MKRNRNRFARLGVLPIVLLLALCLTGVGYGMWSDTVYIEGTITTGEWDCGGTIGFWKNWNNHYNEAEIVPWLAEVDAASKWLGPTTVEGLDQLFAAATGECPPPTMKSRFLAHYMATRLGIASGRLDTGNTHHISGIAGYAYLGLPDPASATLSDIVIAIEGKYPAEPEDPEAWPTDKQYETMKDICDALNNLWI